MQILYAFFWIIPRRPNFIYRRFGTLCLFHLHGQVGMKYDRIEKCWSNYNGKGINTPIFFKSSHTSRLRAYENGTECSETSPYKIQTPGNYPEESIQHSEQGESLKSRMQFLSHLASFMQMCLENKGSGGHIYIYIYIYCK